MRQIATGADGAGYEITFARKMPKDGHPEELLALQKAAEAATEPEERRRRHEALNKAHSEWQADWEKNPASYAAYLLVDGKLEGEYLTGKEAREAAQKLEAPISQSISAAPLRWRTE
jgi:hypothetical protein